MRLKLFNTKYEGGGSRASVGRFAPLYRLRSHVVAGLRLRVKQIPKGGGSLASVNDRVFQILQNVYSVHRFIILEHPCKVL